MSSRIPDTHAEAWALLPWLANGRIAPEDREWVDAHVQGCAECRAELASQRLVATHVNREDSVSPQPAASEEQRSFNKLWARIEASESASTAATGTSGVAVPVPRSSRTVREDRDVGSEAPGDPFAGNEADSDASMRAHSLLNERCSSGAVEFGETSRLISFASIR